MKMFLSVVLSLSLVSFSTHAEQQLPLFPELEYQELLQKIDAVCEEGMGNGHCQTTPYDVEQFDSKKAIEALAEEYYDSERDFQFVATTDAKEILNDEYLREANLKSVVKELVKMNKVKALIKFVPDENCTESESCSISHIYIYLNDGQSIYMGFDFTD